MGINWDLVPHFVRKEFDDPLFPGSGDCVDGEFLILVVKLRLKTGWPMFTHSKVGGAVDMYGDHDHSDGSFHLYDWGACALDFHFDTEAPEEDQIEAVKTIEFPGIGRYYDWHWAGQPLKIGFHIDKGNRYSRWKRVNGNYIYLEE